MMLVLTTAVVCPAAGDLSGRIIDAGSGGAVEGAAIRIPELGLGTSSDPAGRFRLTTVPDGVYTIVVNHIGYEELILRQLPVSAFQNPQLVLELQVRIWAGDTLEVATARSTFTLFHGRPLWRQQLAASGDLEAICRALEEFPGLQVRRNGGSVTVSLDGCPPEQVLICIDGVPLNPGGSEAVDLSIVPLRDSRTLEVVAGAGQTLFGSSGGGMVNFITAEQPLPDAVQASLSSQLSLSLGFNRGWERLALSGDGFLTSGAYPFRDPVRDNRLYRQHNNDRQQLSSVGSWSRRPYRVRLSCSWSERGIPPLIDAQGSADLRRRQERVMLSGTRREDRQRLQLYCHANSLHYDAAPGAADPTHIASSYDYYDSGAGWETELDNWRLRLAAVDHTYRSRDRTGTVPGRRGSRRLLRGGATFLLPDWTHFPAVELEGGATAVLAPQRRLDPLLAVRTSSSHGRGSIQISVEQGLHFPAFLVQFPLEVFQVRGNPDLLPERFVELRCGWLQNGERWLWQVEYRHKTARDLIRWQRGNGNIYRPVNLDRARIQSLTLFSRFHTVFRRWELNGSLQLLDPRNTTPGDINQGYILPSRQLVAGFLRWSGRRDPYFGDITLQFGSRQYTMESNTSHLSLGWRDLEPYLLTSASLGRHLSRGELLIRIDNLFNQNLQRLERQVEPLRTLHLQLRWRL